MVNCTKHKLDNGLTLLLIRDEWTPMVTINTLWNVGGRDEEEGRTGFAHLFEHLMFGGTRMNPDYDAVVERLGGESNAFTNNDYTNYYITVPSGYLEEAIRLEADRMRGIEFSQERLEVQQKVVTEEYNQRYMNKPYGDVWMLLRPLCYERSVYRWCTIGADIEDVAKAKLSEVERFFETYYGPQNATVAIVGNIDTDRALRLAKENFENIEPHGVASGEVASTSRSYVHEPQQVAARRMSVERSVGIDAIYKAYPMCGRAESDFVALDAASDILSNGKSSRLFEHLVKREKVFAEVNAYVTGEQGEGLFVFSGKLGDGVSHEEAEAQLDKAVREMRSVKDEELEKVVSKFAATFTYSHYKAADCAVEACYYDWLGHLEWLNEEPKLYGKLMVADVEKAAAQYLSPERGNTLYYKKK